MSDDANPWLAMVLGLSGLLYALMNRRKTMPQFESIRFEKTGAEISKRAMVEAEKYRFEAGEKEKALPPENVPDAGAAQPVPVAPFMRDVRKAEIEKIRELRESADIMEALARNVDVNKVFSLTFGELTLLGF